MALIVCKECGKQISSYAQFCPKCNHSKNNIISKSAVSADYASSGSDRSGTVSPPANAFSNFVGISAPLDNAYSSSEAASNEELLQLEFMPSIDEMMILEGKTSLIKGFLNVSACYAYLTSKRYALCDASGVHIIFQIGNNGFASIEEGRHLLSRKIIINTVSGETYQVKSRPHYIWLSALLDPQGAVAALKKPDTGVMTGSADGLEWFYEKDGFKIGPILEKNMIQLIQNNHTVYRNTNVWNTYLNEWKRAEETILAFYFNPLP